MFALESSDWIFALANELCGSNLYMTSRHLEKQSDTSFISLYSIVI